MIDFSSIPADCIFTCRNGDQLARCEIETVETGRLVRDFPFVDSKGRRIGGRIVLSDETATLAADGNRLTDALGLRFVARPHALRDGELFGASQSCQYFATAIERDAYVAKYFRDAEKRAAKTGRPA